MKLAKATALSTMLSCGAAHALDFNGATVQSVRPDTWEGGTVFIRVKRGTVSGVQSCQFPDGTTNFYVIDKTHPMFEEIFDVALAAQTSRRLVTVVGDATCTPGGGPPDYEGIRSIRITE